MSGKVYLIGAGPGDPELLTIKATRALARADVVMIDDLVDRRVLDFAPAARVIEVGKRGGCKSTPQDFIERLMVRLAARGKIVARVKGGDPFVFGRGGEEVLALAKKCIDYEVIPGITAGIGVPAALGIPVTHRGLARGVTFVTGHTRDGGEPDWAALARTDTTLVIYMGMQRISAIAAALQAAGMAASTPAAAIQNGTTDDERHVIATLGTLAAAASKEKLGSPALIVIGHVVALANAKANARALKRTA